MITKSYGKLVQISCYGLSWHITVLRDGGDYASTCENVIAALNLYGIGPRLYGLIKKYGPKQPSDPMPTQLFNLEVEVECYEDLVLYVELYGPAREALK